jgi:hypothetical protein
MLVTLFGSNFRSLRDNFELSMVAADLKRKEDSERGIIEVPLAGSDEPIKLLRTVGIFGHNGSGKSTILLAARSLQFLAAYSSLNARPGGQIPQYLPFALDKRTRHAPVALGCQVLLADSLLRYEISYRADLIERESLTVRNPEEVVLLERDGQGDVKGRLIEKSDANRVYVRGMQPNVSVLSKLAQHGPAKGEDSVRPFYDAIVRATMWEDYSFSSHRRHGVREPFVEQEEYRNWIMRNLIVPADVGIGDVVVGQEDVPNLSGLKDAAASFVHKGSDSQPLEFFEESAGTKKLFNIAGDWWRLSREEIALFADELSASLHPRLLDALIRAVNDAPSDRLRSQLVFATHDTGLLESQDGKAPALRRDQVYFTKKGADGASELYSLAEFKEEARPVHNLRKRYLSGLYGAIPLVEKISL